MDFRTALKMVQEGFETWKAKSYNRRWAASIKGTPIENDVCVIIAENVAKEVNVIEDLVIELNRRLVVAENDLSRLWHFAGCPYDHCETCIADAKWIKSLAKRLGPPSAKSVQAQHDDR